MSAPETASAGNPPPEPATDRESETTGLPWFHTWRAVYWFVFASFILWVALLFALARMFP